MLAAPQGRREGMSWLDRLLGRERHAPEAPAAFTEEEAPERVETDELEEGATRARDEELGIENRLPPGSG
jgi:hypothetical protein